MALCFLSLLRPVDAVPLFVGLLLKGLCLRLLFRKSLLLGAVLVDVLEFLHHIPQHLLLLSRLRCALIISVPEYYITTPGSEMHPAYVHVVVLDGVLPIRAEDRLLAPISNSQPERAK